MPCICMYMHTYLYVRMCVYGRIRTLYSYAYVSYVQRDLENKLICMCMVFKLLISLVICYLAYSFLCM